MTGCILALFFITFGGLKRATHGMFSANAFSHCTGRTPQITYYFKIVLPWIFSAMTAWLPCTLLFMANILIIVRLHSRQDTILHSNATGKSKLSDAKPPATDLQRQKVTIQLDVNIQPKDLSNHLADENTNDIVLHQPREAFTRSKSSKTSQKFTRQLELRRIRVTRSVLVLSFTYLTLMLPWTISHLILPFSTNAIEGNILISLKLLAWCIHSTNIVLYSFFNRTIRKEILDMLRCK